MGPNSKQVLALLAGLTTALAGLVPLARAQPEPTDRHIPALLDRGCAACHGAAHSERIGVPDLMTRAIVPGFAEQSTLFEVLVSRHHGADPVREYWDAWPDTNEIEAVRAWIDGRPASQTSQGQVQVRPSSADRPHLEISTDRRRYRPGDVVTITASATSDCHLILVSIDGRGDAIVLFPNDLDRDNGLESGVARVVPPADGGYRFRARSPGTERIVGWCTAEPSPLAGIKFAFANQRFPILGSWSGALSGMIMESLALENVASRRRPANRRGPQPQSLFAPHGYAAMEFRISEPRSASDCRLDPALESGKAEPAARDDGCDGEE